MQKFTSVIVISCALFASLITLFGWVILPILFFVVISVYAIWMVGTISITQKKWDEERNKKRWGIDHIHSKKISHDDDGNEIENITEVTEYDVLDLYWPQWYERKVKEVGEGHHSITEEHCIKEWVKMVGAWETT